MIFGSKRPKKKTKFTVKETKEVTVLGAALGVISVVTVILLLYLTFARGGEANLSFAFAGLLASIFAVAGLIISILCLIDHYQEHLVGWIGFAANGIALLSLAGILYLGMV